MLDKQSKMVLDSIIANESQYERYFLQKDKPLDFLMMKWSAFCAALLPVVTLPSTI